MRILLFGIILLMYGCSSPNVAENEIKRDTVIFTGVPHNTYRQVVGDWGLRTLDDKPMGFLAENSSYTVKASAGNLDLKLNLLPKSKNLTITPVEERFNEFLLTTSGLSPDSSQEKAIVYFIIDTTYNKPVFIRRDYPDDSNYLHIDYYLNWDGLGEEQLIIRKNVD
jgi:hypothetical protein